MTAGRLLDSSGSLISVPLVRGAKIYDAVLLGRPNRFVIEARLETGEAIRAHCADRGRLLWLTPGAPLLVGSMSGENRKTAFQAAAAWMNGAWASLDTHLPNRLIEHALRTGALKQFTGYPTLRREMRCGLSRYDFYLEDGERQCYIEVKSVGAVHDGVGLFPDAPTDRGRRHVDELASLASRGVRTAVIFVAQHAGASSVRPCRVIDPGFADALRNAVTAGVDVHAYRCPVERSGITLAEAIGCDTE